MMYIKVENKCGLNCMNLKTTFFLRIVGVAGSSRSDPSKIAAVFPPRCS